ncbi:two-component system regulatory protein YycI [Metabacillus sp. KIGAM252]|uniref:Two-component system regulatory protein YycI n=1 Tax=Metabacillus flavus TaxID=2823519 RepID=A0ABS5LL63_9BACI|nr:two-component system regulatory protein YycI [Metabacillus flavus]MBS2971074.1 two-component system regulatory protein YycI [Metabacillus flavus]
MDWSKTKTIFIFAFLVLDLFLAWQYSQKITTSKYDPIQKETIQDQLAAEEIKYPPLPPDNPELQLLAVKRHEFTDEDLSTLKDQEPAIDIQDQIGETEPVLLQMKLKKPIKIEKDDLSKADSFVSSSLKFGSEYVFWSYNQEKAAITYFQRINGMTIYQGSDQPIGAVILHLNEKREIISYEQTYVMESDQVQEQQEDTITAIEAIEQMYNENDLKYKSEITKMELGYYTEQAESNKQTLQPYWYVEVNGKEHYFVSAFEGQIVRPEKATK